MEGYTKSPYFAWSGWRYRIPGGPIGGQYHGFIATTANPNAWPAGMKEIYRPADSYAGLGQGVPVMPGDSADPWNNVWGGTFFEEGQTPSDHVYRSIAEVRPRPNASGGVNVVSAAQTRRSAGYAIAPGNYKGLGVVMPMVRACPEFMRDCDPGETPTQGPCGPSCVSMPLPGATNVVSQPPPPSGPGSGYTVQSTVPPTSPRPAPTVATGQPSTATSTDWFSSDSIINGIPNLWIAAGAAVAALMLLRGHKKA